jgi:hypothetical protein
MIHTLIESPDNKYFFEEDQSARTPTQMTTPVSPSTPQVPAALEKTRMCVYFLQGRCKYEDCSFAHSVHELKQAPSNLRKTKICDLYMMGHCQDTHCNFAHSTVELKVKPKRSGSAAGASLLQVGSPASSRCASFDRTPPNPTPTLNSDSCARTILSMLIKMQPEAAAAFLSNPECKAILEQLVSPSSRYSPTEENVIPETTFSTDSPLLEATLPNFTDPFC